jgi:tRNA A-37 threonylcarbamoyl transferase component Bud32
MKETEDYRSPSRAEQPPVEEDRLVVALRAYQTAVEEGRRPDRDEFLALYPEVAEDLAECIDGLAFLQSAAPGLHTGHDPADVVAPVTPEDGTLGDFRLVREIGRGGMGVVYEAVQISLCRRVALKVLPLAATLDARQLQRFENEARAAAALHHANIVPVFAVGCARGVHYYAMQFIDGQTLAGVIDHLRKAPRPAAPGADTVVAAGSITHLSVASRTFFRTAATLGVQAAEALEYAHQMGVVHRDVKPANLLLDGRGNLWVTDFGLARFQASPGVTTPGDLVGTLRYMSPEQAAGQPVIDPRSDVYSLGATLYELLTQQPAFPGRNRQECLRQILEEEPEAPHRLNKAVPAELETIVLKAMAKRPEDRYATAKELADDLRRWLDDQPVRARRPGLRERAARWARRHRRVVTAAVLGLVAAVLVLGATTWHVARAEARTRTAYTALEQEKARTKEALDTAVAQRGLAESNYRQARKVLDYLTRLGVEEMADKPELQGLRKRLLTELVAYYQEFIEQHGDDPDAVELIETKLQVAELLDQVGRRAESLVVYQEARRGCARLPGGGPPGGPFGRFFGPPRGLARLFLVGQPAVQQDLKLSPEQVKKVAALTDFGRRPPTGRGLAGAEKALDGVLEPKQAERLLQLVRQSRGSHSLLDPETATALGLKEEQKRTIFFLLTRSLRKPREGFGGPPWGGRWGKGRGSMVRRDHRHEGPGGPGPVAQGEPRQKGHAGARRDHRHEGPGGPPRGGPAPEVNARQVDEQVLRVLTDEQRKRWQKMRGEPFRGDLRFGPPPPPPPQQP